MSGVETFTQTKSFLGFLSPTPVEVSCAHLPLPTSAWSTHRTRTHTGQTDPHGTRDTHTEPHGTSTRDTHTMYSSLHIKLSCVCGIVSCLISPVGSVICMLAASVNVCAVLCGPLAHGMSMRPYRQDAEVTGDLPHIVTLHARAVAVAPSASRALLARTDKP